MLDRRATGPAGAVRFRRSCASLSTVAEMSPRASDSPLTGAVVPPGTEVRTSLAELLAAWLSKVGPPVAASPSLTLTDEPAAAPALTLTRTTTLTEALRAR